MEPETPVPLQVPPPVPVTKLFKLIDPAAAHIGEGLVHAADCVGHAVVTEISSTKYLIVPFDPLTAVVVVAPSVKKFPKEK